MLRESERMASRNFKLEDFIRHHLHDDTVMFIEAVQQCPRPSYINVGLWNRGRRDLLLHLLDLRSQATSSLPLEWILGGLNFLTDGGVEAAIIRRCDILTYDDQAGHPSASAQSASAPAPDAA